MSIVSSVFSPHNSTRINARIAFFMDNLFAIGFGLGLRFIVDSVSHNDFKLTGTLIGLWEGVVTLHFMKKMPKSSDPYIAYAARLFVDFMITESLARMVLVIVWTGLGMVLADIAPAVWLDVGGHRIWRRFRRDMYYISRSLPLPIFPRTRVVRFSPTIEPVEISETISTLSPSAVTPTVTSQVPTTQIIPPTPAAPRVSKRPIPGGFAASVVSETDTELGSVLGFHRGASTVGMGRQASVRPRRSSFDSATPSSSAANDLDDTSSTSDASSASTETVGQPVEIQEVVEEPIRTMGKGKERAIDKDDGTPTQRNIELPPTPSDSNRPHPYRSSIVPTISGMPSIPDFFEPGLGSDWEDIRKEDVLPTPPEKDLSPPPRLIPPPAPSTFGEPTPRPSTFDQDLWDSVSNAAPPETSKRSAPTPRPSRPPTTATAAASTSRSSRHKRQKPDPPPVSRTPVFGDSWDIEKDQLPPPTPSLGAGTPRYIPPDLDTSEPPQPNVDRGGAPPDREKDLPLPQAEPEQQQNGHESGGGNPWAQGEPTSQGHQEQPQQPQQPQVVNPRDRLDQQQKQPLPASTPDDLFNFTEQVKNLGGDPAAGLRDPLAQQGPKPDEDLINLGDIGGEGGAGGGDGAGGGGDHGDDEGRSGDAGNGVGNDDVGHVTAEGQGATGEHAPQGGDAGMFSPISSAYSSVAGVPEGIRERNKQAIVIRAQIEEVMKTIERLKEEKVKAQGREEMDPLLEESHLKEVEIARAERTLEKLTKRAEKRHQAALESTGQTVILKGVNDSFTTSTSLEAARKLEDLLGLFFTPDRKTINLTITIPRGGPGKAMTTAMQKVLDEYGMKGTQNLTRFTVNVSPGTYQELIVAFRQKHSLQPADP